MKNKLMNTKGKTETWVEEYHKQFPGGLVAYGIEMDDEVIKFCSTVYQQGRADAIEEVDIEKLAEIEHKQWQSWLQYLIEHFQTLTVNTFIATRKDNYLTEYNDLPEEEKEKDRVWARKVLSALHQSTREK